MDPPGGSETPRPRSPAPTTQQTAFWKFACQVTVLSLCAQLVNALCADRPRDVTALAICDHGVDVLIDSEQRVCGVALTTLLTLCWCFVVAWLPR